MTPAPEENPKAVQAALLAWIENLQLDAPKEGNALVAMTAAIRAYLANVQA